MKKPANMGMRLEAERPLGLKSVSLLLVLMTVIALPRFNRNTLLIEAPPRDDVQYRLYVRYFRGEPVEDQLRPASTWRPLVPMVASVLPVDPMTALSLTNLLALALAVVMTVRSCALIGCPRRLQMVGGCLFVVSFPQFYYSTIGYVDPGVIGLLALAVYLLLRRRWLWLALTLIAGAAAKESMVVAVPAAIIAAWIGEPKRKSVWLSLAFVLVYILAAVILRHIVPGPSGPAFWSVNFEIFLNNAVRPRAWLSGALTFGLPGVLLVWGLVVERKSIGFHCAELPLLAGTLAGVAIWIAAFLSAAVDGRTLWSAYPFAIPLGILLLTRHQMKAA